MGALRAGLIGNGGTIAATLAKRVLFMAKVQNTATPAPVVPVTLSATPAPATAQPSLVLGKYAKASATLGAGYMGNCGAAQFKLGVWPRSVANPSAPANGQAPAKATVPQALWLAAQAAGATANKAVSGLAIGQAALAVGTPANAALMCSKAATALVKGISYAGGGKACGLWLAGYIGPNKGAACVKFGALIAA